jgi:predicted RNase H-like HicB family nuclease
MGLDEYKVVLYRKRPSDWVAEIPSIPGCYALMSTRAEATFRTRAGVCDY